MQITNSWESRLATLALSFCAAEEIMAFYKSPTTIIINNINNIKE